MNTNILKKCVEELKKESPKIDYVLGMLESVIELSDVSPIYPYTPPIMPVANFSSNPIAAGSGLDISIPESYVTNTGPLGKIE